jgi:phenylalanyl-tRNA synthetase beta chain
VTVKPSPLIIQTYLSRVGLRPINNIVDVTNYLMVLTGQPLHAYDYDKVKAESGEVPTLVARKAGNGEKIALLNGKTLTFSDPAILITTDKGAVGVGGVMGGAETEVDEHTKNIILECANFDMYSIRRTSMKYGLFTDAVTRFNKGQSPLQNDRVLEEAVTTLEYVSGGHVASDVFDVKTELPEPATVSITSGFVSSRLGLATTAEEITRTLQNVEFAVQPSSEDLTVTPPFWRTDIEIPEDIVEEVGRLIGFDQLPIELPTRSIRPTDRNALFDLKARIRDVLSRAGANEVLTYSFVHGDLLDKVGQDKSQAFRLSNALSPDMQYYRFSLIPSLLEKVHPNVKAGYDSFALFEIGKGHNKSRVEDNLPKEAEKTALVITDAGKESGAAYFAARVYLDFLAEALGLSLRYEPLEKEPDYQTAKPFESMRSAHVIDAKSGQVIGIIGEFKQSVSRALKLPSRCAGFELSTAKLSPTTPQTTYVPLSRYPKVTQDMTLKVKSNLYYQELADFVHDAVQKAQPDNVTSNIELLDIYQRDDQFRRITFRLTIASYERTLTDAEVNSLLDTVALAAHEKFGAERI